MFSNMKKLTNRTANEFYSHGNPRVPSLRMDSDVRSDDGFEEGVGNYRMTITVSLEDLQKGMDTHHCIVCLPLPPLPLINGERKSQ